MGRPSDFTLLCKKNHFPWGQEESGRLATQIRESISGGALLRTRKQDSSGGSSRLRAEVRAAFTAGKADESVGQKQEPVRGGEAGLLHPQTRKLSGGWGGTGPPRRQRVHHRTFSPRPPPSCRSASSSPRSSCICPPLAERSRARAARGSPLATILSAGGRPAPGPRPQAVTSLWFPCP